MQTAQIAQTARNVVFVVGILSFLIGGMLDVRHDPKTAVVAFLFALSNAVIFFWR